MQNTQEINWLAVILPSVITGIFAISTQYIFAKRLSKKTEKFKSELSKELENHKVELQKDFQTKFFQFQTKFSAFHQEQAMVIKNLYSLFSKVDSDITQLYFDAGSDLGLFNVDDVSKNLEELMDYFKGNKIFLNDEIIRLSNLVISDFWKVLFASGELKENHEFARAIKEKRKYEPNEFRERFNVSEFVGNPVITGLKKIKEEIPELMQLLEKEFRKIIYIENLK